MSPRSVRLALGVALLVAAACAVPEDARPRVIAAEDIPLPSSSTSTAPAAGTETIEIWLVRARSDPPVLQPVDRGVETPNVQSALEALLAAPDEGTTEGTRYDSLIPEGTTLTWLPDQPETTIQIGAVEGPPQLIFGIQGSQQILAFAQIVATAMAIRGVTGVRFVQPDGSPFNPPNEAAAPVSDRAVTIEDYASLLDD